MAASCEERVVGRHRTASADFEPAADPHAGPAEQGAGGGLGAADRGGDLGAAEALGREEERGPGIGAQVREDREEVGAALAPEVARLRGDGRRGRRRGAADPDDPPEGGRDAPAAADREVGADPVQPGPDVVRRPAGPDLGRQAQVRLLEEVLGHLGIAGGPDEEREDLLVVVGPGGHDRRVRLRGAVGACGVDRFEGRGHRFHGDETLWPSRCFRTLEVQRVASGIGAS